MVGKNGKVAGVDFHKNKWRARLNVDGKRVELGYYNTKDEAVNAILHAQNSNDLLNIPEGYIRHPTFDTLYINKDTKDIMRLKNGKLVSLNQKKGFVEYVDNGACYRHKFDKLIEECEIIQRIRCSKKGS